MAFLRSSPMVWCRQQQSAKLRGLKNCILPLTSPHGFCPTGTVYITLGLVGTSSRIHGGPKWNVPNRYAPRAVSLDIPPSKDGSERIGTHTLTVHRYGFPTYFER